MTDTTTLTHIIVPLDGGQVAERAIPVAAALAAPGSFSLRFVTVLSDSDMEDNAATYLKAQAEVLADDREAAVARSSGGARGVVAATGGRHPGRVPP